MKAAMTALALIASLAALAHEALAKSSHSASSPVLLCGPATADASFDAGDGKAVCRQ
jgi:hypothetical protein